MENNNNPIIFYIIVRESLHMSSGKVAAQCSHAMEKFIMNYFKTQLLDIKYPEIIPEKDKTHIQITKEWFHSLSRVVVLAADEKEWAKLKEEFGKEIVLIKDAGLTEVEPESETVIGLWPMHKDEAPKIVKRLQVLK